MHFKKAAIAAALALSGIAPVAAQETGLYLGGAIGQTSTDIDTEQLSTDLRLAGFSHTPISTDDSDTGWKAILGYRFNRNIAAELSYVQLGEISASTNISIPPSPATASLSSTWEPKNTFTLAALGILPLGSQFSIFGKLGGYTTKLEQRVRASGPGGTFVDSASESSTGLLYGVGLGYDVTRTIGVRAEWERFTSVGDNATTGEGDIDLLTVGLTFRLQ